MSSPFSNNPSWRHQNNVPTYNTQIEHQQQQQQQQFYLPQQINPGQIQNPHQYGQMAPQPVYHPQEQQRQQPPPPTYWNNNKPPLQQWSPQYPPIPPHVQSCNPVVNPNPHLPVRMSQESNQTGPDPWSWGWDDSSNNSPRQPQANNNDNSWNWNVDECEEQTTQQINSVQSYFVRQPRHTDIPPANTDIPNIEVNTASARLTVENLAEINSHHQELNVDQKSESVHSFQSRNSAAKSETQTDRTSPDPDKIPLTTQALREFHNEIYENGPVDVKSRHNADGLTPQWSIESQMSQDTISDDISPSVQGGSQSDVENRLQSDMDTRPSTVSQSPLSNQHQGSFEQTWYDYPRPVVEHNQAGGPERADSNNEQVQNRMFVSVRTDLYDQQTLTEGLSNLTLDNRGEDVENKEIVSPERCEQLSQQAEVVGPPPLAPPAHSTTSNPFSNRRPLSSHRFVKTVPVYQGLTQSAGSHDTYDPVPDKQQAGESTEVKTQLLTEEFVNLESVPENKERPDLPERKNVPVISRNVQSVGSQSVWTSNNWKHMQYSPENQEVAPRCGPDRNQYLETGQLEEVAPLETTSGNDAESLPPPGLSRLVTGEGQQQPEHNQQQTPPPGLDRMVLGQFQDNDNVGYVNLTGATLPAGFHRMVVGRTTDESNSVTVVTNTSVVLGGGGGGDEVPPPGLHRMIPGESSSPESQTQLTQSNTNSNNNKVYQHIDTRIVTGVDNDDVETLLMQTSVPLANSSPVPVVRLSSQSNTPEDNAPPPVRLQPQSERCETIGSDHVETYQTVPSPSGSSHLKMSKRKERHELERDDGSSDDNSRDMGGSGSGTGPMGGGGSGGGGGAGGGGGGSGGSGRHRGGDRDVRDDYYRERDRERTRGERDYSPEERMRGGGGGKDRRGKRRDSPGRYREEKERRRGGEHRDDRRRRRDYDYSDEDLDGSGYYSDRDRRSYRDVYDRSYVRRDERARTLDRPDKSSRDQRDRVRDRRRDYDRDPRHPDYYGPGRRRTGHDDPDEVRSSRPTSRNGSVHDFKQRYTTSRGDYEQDRDRDHYRGHSKRPPHSAADPYYQAGYNYDPAYFNYYYQYYENLRRTNPAAYAEICRKYYANSQPGTYEGTYTEDRASVHSGRSSANEDNKDRSSDKQDQEPPPPLHRLVPAHDYGNYEQSQSSDTCGVIDTGRSMQFEEIGTSAQRLTPAKFTTAHVKGVMTGHGQLLKILAHYPLDGQSATVEIHEQIQCLEETRKELQDFPGPLVKGVTHKNNVVRYCKQKIKEADGNSKIYDKDSYKLIWELLILLIRQNGTVVGTDISELLMSNRSSHVTPSPASSHHSISEQQQTGNSLNNHLSENDVTNQFRDYLIYGNSKEALEWAMKHGLWGHALFLASKMDQRTYASVMTRFANGLTINDPLQTLYQLMSGRQPAAVTCLSDERWGDWRPHLAMILSNASTRPDTDHRAITTLGDTLGSRGSLYASHFCYLMAQVQFGSYAHKSSKLVLIGSSHSQPFVKFSTNEAIFATEIFEFACNLADSEFSLHHLQVYKLLVAKRLLEASMPQEAVHYVEVIANTIARQPALYAPSFIQDVYDLGNRLKFYDPLFTTTDTGYDSLTAEPNWLAQLLVILNDYQLGVLQHDGYGSVSNLTYSESDQVPNQEPGILYDPSQQWQQQPQQQQQQQQQPPQQYYSEQLQNAGAWQTNDNRTYVESPPEAVNLSSGNDVSDSLNHQQYWQPQQQQQQWNVPQQQQLDSQQQNVLSPASSDYNNSHSQTYNYYDNKHEENGPVQGRITLPAQQTKREDEQQRKKKTGATSPAPAGAQTKQTSAPKINQTSGWFGGLWNKLALRPKNQMNLPDDKDPTIVWDPDKKRWVDLDSGDDETASAPPPPPKAAELQQMTSVQQPSSAANIPSASATPPGSAAPPPPPSNTTNIYKMSKGKSLRSNYVNVLNSSGGGGGGTNAPPPDLFPSLSPAPPPPTLTGGNFFIPAPVEGIENAPTDFLTQNNNTGVRTDFSDQLNKQQSSQALSRWSSTSSLSREVQKYTVARGKSLKKSDESANVVNNQYQSSSRPHSRTGFIMNKPPLPMSVTYSQIKTFSTEF